MRNDGIRRLREQVGSTVNLDPLPPGYADFLADLKGRIRTARVKAALAVDRDLLLLYWQIGRGILDRRDREGWGARVIDRLSHDFRHEFPEM